jgi:cytochrome d ubiquinol oxidase subunit I
MSHLIAGRAQMGTSLAFHLSFAVFGVGLPVMMLIAEGLHLRTGEDVWLPARLGSTVSAFQLAVGLLAVAACTALAASFLTVETGRAGGALLLPALWLLYGAFRRHLTQAVR